MIAWRFTRTKPCTSPNGRTDGHRLYLTPERNGPEYPATDDPHERIHRKLAIKRQPPGGVTMVCAFCGLPGYVRIAALVVEAATFFDARAVAQVELQTTDLAWAVADAAGAEIRVRWEGSDAGAHPTRVRIVEAVNPPKQMVA